MAQTEELMSQNVACRPTVYKTGAWINIDPESFVYLQGCLANLDVGGDTANPVKSALVPSEHVLEGCGGNYFSSALILMTLILHVHNMYT